MGTRIQITWHTYASSEKFWHVFGACLGYSSTVNVPMVVLICTSGMGAAAAMLATRHVASTRRRYKPKMRVLSAENAAAGVSVSGFITYVCLRFVYGFASIETRSPR